MTVSGNTQSNLQVPDLSSSLGGLALIVPQRHMNATWVEVLRSVAEQYVDLFGLSPVTLPYAPASSTLLCGTPLESQPRLRVDAYHAPPPTHPRSSSFPLWVKRVSAIASRYDFGVLAIPRAFHSTPPGLIVSDVDSTVIAQEVIEEIADFVGTRDQVEAITDRAMNGELDFTQSLRQRVATLKGVPVGVLQAVAAHIEIRAGARELFEVVHHFGGYCGVVSGGFVEIVKPLADCLNIDHYAAHQLSVKDGILTGRIDGDIITGQTKAELLKRWAEQDGVPLERTVAVGDGANDIPMLQLAGLGVAFCPTPIVRNSVDSVITVPRLDVLTALF